MANADKLWEIYTHNKDPKVKEELILHYAQLVKYVAGRVSMHFGGHVEYEDLVSYGIFGLIDAIDKYDPAKGVKFETYASLRIRGSIIDNIRKLDWVPRSLRHKNKKVDSVFAELEAELGREPSDSELAERLDIPIEELHDTITKANAASVISLDDYVEQNNEASGNIVNTDISSSPDLSYERLEAKQMLVDGINKLSEKERKVISLYYFEELTLKEISAILGVSESRISQIHSKAVLKLQAKLGKYKSLLFGV